MQEGIQISVFFVNCTYLQIIVAMTHCTKHGKSKILKACTLPLTGHRVVDKIITDKAVFKVCGTKLVLEEIGSHCTLQDITDTTEAEFSISNTLRIMDDK